MPDHRCLDMEDIDQFIHDRRSYGDRPDSELSRTVFCLTIEATATPLGVEVAKALVSTKQERVQLRFIQYRKTMRTSSIDDTYPLAAHAIVQLL